MKWITWRALWGILLVGGGILFLLNNLGLIEIGSYFWSLVFTVAGLGFLSVFVTDRQNWWALIPGFVLLGIGSIIYIDQTFPELTGLLGGVIVLGSIGLSFLIIYLVNRDNWWAIIPAGVMITLAVVSGLGEVLTGFDMGGIFFIGLGLTFLIVGVLPTPHGQMRWAFIPAGILLGIGVLIMLALSTWVGYLWPVALILAGLFIIYRTFRRR